MEEVKNKMSLRELLSVLKRLEVATQTNTRYYKQMRAEYDKRAFRMVKFQNDEDPNFCVKAILVI